MKLARLFPLGKPQRHESNAREEKGQESFPHNSGFASAGNIEWDAAEAEGFMGQNGKVVEFGLLQLQVGEEGFVFGPLSLSLDLHVAGMGSGVAP